MLAAGLVSSGLVLAWMVWTARAKALVIDRTLDRQLEGIRWTLDGSRTASEIVRNFGDCDQVSYVLINN